MSTFIRSFFAKEHYPLKGKIALWNNQNNTQFYGNACINFANYEDLIMGIERDEILIDSCNIIDSIGLNNNNTYECKEIIEPISKQNKTVKVINIPKEDFSSDYLFCFAFFITQKKSSQKCNNQIKPIKLTIQGTVYISPDITLSFDKNNTSLTTRVHITSLINLEDKYIPDDLKNKIEEWEYNE
jgi:hypothetical protein